MKKLILGFGLLASMGICQQGCALDDAPATAVQTSKLDATGNYYGSRIGHSAFKNAASAVSFGNFVYNDVSSPTSESKVTALYQEIATEIGPTSLTGASFTSAKAATFGTRVLTWHADAIANLSVSTDVLPFFVGNEDGVLNTNTPTGCATQIGGTTFTGYVPEPMDPGAEAFRVSQGLTDQGLYLWCPGIVEISHDANGQLQGRTLVSGVITPVSLSACNVNTDTVDQCIGAMLGATHKIALASKNAKTASHDLPKLDNIVDSDADVTNQSWPFGADVTVTKKNSLTDMASIWSRIRDGGTGQAAFLSDLEALGASAP